MGARTRRLPQCGGLRVGGCSEQRPLPCEPAILQEDAASVAAMRKVHVKRTRPHQNDLFVLEAKSLWTAQNAPHELIGGPQSESQGMLGTAFGILKQEPAEMPLHCFSGLPGLRRNKVRNIGNVVLGERDKLGRRILLLRNYPRDSHCAASW